MNVRGSHKDAAGQTISEPSSRSAPGWENACGDPAHSDVTPEGSGTVALHSGGYGGHEDDPNQYKICPCEDGGGEEGGGSAKGLQVEMVPGRYSDNAGEQNRLFSKCRRVSPTLKLA